jgi:hypothetical protein
MIETVEVNHIDTRYERLRLKDRGQELLLQSSIMEHGILDPLYVVGLSDSAHVLLDGFKRYRCAVKLSIPSVPVATLEGDMVVGILKFLRLSLGKRLTSLEEAGLVDELSHVHGLSAVEIARRLERSLTWVSLRLGLIREMSNEVREKIFSGQFPVRSYMYSLRHFTRVKEGGLKGAVTAFVACVSGKGLSTRDIDRLAQAYFKGGAVLKAQIESGQLDWTLRQLKENEARQATPNANFNEHESRVLSQLEILYAYIIKLSYGLKDTRLTSPDFFTAGQKAAHAVLKAWDGFRHTLQEFYDTTGEKTSGACAASCGKG